MGNFTQPKIGPLSISALVIMIGAVVGIVALFLNWYDYEYSLILTTLNEKITGIGFLSEKTDAFQKYCPLVSWILMVMVFILNVLPLLNVRVIPEKQTYLATAALGLLSLATVIVYLSWTDYSAIGSYLGLIASILVLIGGSLPMVEEIE